MLCSAFNWNLQVQEKNEEPVMENQLALFIEIQAYTQSEDMLIFVDFKSGHFES